MLFRRTNRYGYSRYYGNGGTIWRIVKIILFLLVIAALIVGIALWGLQRYVVYDETGTHLVLPWMSQEEDTPGGESLTGGEESSSQLLPEVIIEDESSSDVPPEEGGASSSGVTPEEVPVPLSQLLAFRVERGSLSNGAALVQNAGGNAVLVYLKISAGTVYFPSSAALASELGTPSSSGASILEQVTALQTQGTPVVAYLDCFRDNTVGGSSRYALKTTGGSRWKDSDSRAWSDPANEAVQDYMASLVRELAQAGVSEVVLCNAAYPTSGNTGNVAAVEDKAAVISAFYQKLGQAVEGTDTLVSVFTDSETVTTGTNATSGQTLTALAQLNGRLWVSDSTDAEALQAALEAAGISGDHLCLSTRSLDGAGTVSQFVLS